MDGRKFDNVTRVFAESKTRRGVLKGMAGASLAGLMAAIGVGRAGAEEKLACNTNEKCEARCGTEAAQCCNGFCVKGCGPNRSLNPRTCKCVRITRSGQLRKSGPFFCGA